MKSVKEKAIEAERNTYPLFESIRESTGEPVSVYDQNDMLDMFEAGANYVLDEVKILLNSQRFVDNPSQELFELIEQLKK